MKKNPYANRVKWYDGFSVVVCLLIVACVLWAMSIHEVETYTFHATITNMEVTRPYRSYTDRHYIYWCDDDVSGTTRVDPITYARYREGDLIEITGVIKADCFGREAEFFEIRG